MIRPEALLVDRQSPAKQRLRLGVAGLSVKQHAELVHEPAGRCRDLGVEDVPYNRFYMRCERIELLPGTDILRITRKTRIDPVQRLSEPGLRRVHGEAAPGDILHETMG
jgi:hypothetical protein